MKWRLISDKFATIVLSYFILIPFTVIGNEIEPQEIEVTQWLILEPVAINLPVYHDQKNIKGESYGIASYWGEGFWGFQYSAVATAYSFPWNRDDIYVGQSPLYSADKVQTPLLFLTGMSDPNVPPGESLQMYTALKLLERETAFVQVEDQDHHIVDYQKYKLWKESILAWFDKYLKDQPQWWQEKYGE